MKTIKISIALLALTSLVALAFSNVGDFTKAEGNAIEQPKDLYGQWLLSHYEVFGEAYPPEEIEKNDFIDFHPDNTYSSRSSGVQESGTYRFDGAVIAMANSTEKGELRLIAKTLTPKKLVVVIDDPTDPDAKYLTIHFKH